MKKRAYASGIAAAATAFVACGGPGFVADTSPLAIEAGDFTGLIRVEGCGFQPQVQEGYTYCRVVEGPVGALALTFLGPPNALACAPHSCPAGDAACDPTSCVDFTLFFPDQSPAYQDSIPAGQSSKTIPWSKLTQKQTFDLDDTGFWLYTYTIRWKDHDGNLQKTVSDGEIRLRVVRAKVCDGTNCQAYVPLRSAPNDPSFVWSWTEGSQLIRMTTAGRTYVQLPGGP